MARQVGLKASEGLDNHLQKMHRTPREMQVSAVSPEVSNVDEYPLGEETTISKPVELQQVATSTPSQSRPKRIPSGWPWGCR